MVARTYGLLLAALSCRCRPAARADRTRTDPLHVSFPAPQTHYVEVTADVPTDGRPGGTDDGGVDAGLVPDSRVREECRGVTATGQGGRALAIEKSDKNRWRVATGGAPSVTVKYRVYAREMSVRTNWVEADFAMINGAPTFMTLVGGMRAAARGRHRARARLARLDDRPGPDAGRQPPLSRRRLRRAGRFADSDRQSRGVRVHGRRQEALPREHRRGGRVRRRESGKGSGGDRPGTAALLGLAAVRPVHRHERPDRQQIAAAASSTRTRRC